MHKRHERERSWYGRMSKSGIDDTGLRCARSKVLRNWEQEDILGGFQVFLRLLRVGDEGELGEGGDHRHQLGKSGQSGHLGANLGDRNRGFRSKFSKFDEEGVEPCLLLLTNSADLLEPGPLLQGDGWQLGNSGDHVNSSKFSQLGQKLVGLVQLGSQLRSLHGSDGGGKSRRKRSNTEQVRDDSIAL